MDLHESSLCVAPDGPLRCPVRTRDEPQTVTATAFGDDEMSGGMLTPRHCRSGATTMDRLPCGRGM